MVKHFTLAALAAAVVLLTPVTGQAQVPYDQPRSPGASWGAAAINVVYVPVRFAVSAIGATLSGLTGWLTGGNSDVAEEVWGEFRGSTFVTPAMLQGHEPFRFGPWETGH